VAPWPNATPRRTRLTIAAFGRRAACAGWGTVARGKARQRRREAARRAWRAPAAPWMGCHGPRVALAAAIVCSLPRRLAAALRRRLRVRPGEQPVPDRLRAPVCASTAGVARRPRRRCSAADGVGRLAFGTPRSGRPATTTATPPTPRSLRSSGWRCRCRLRRRGRARARRVRAWRVSAARSVVASVARASASALRPSPARTLACSAAHDAELLGLVACLLEQPLGALEVAERLLPVGCTYSISLANRSVRNTRLSLCTRSRTDHACA
jgi:hypothetical protein